MTEKAKRLLSELETLPEGDQNEVARALLERLRRQNEERTAEEENDEALYASFRVLKDAQLQLSPDASETYEDELYGRDDQ